MLDTYLKFRMAIEIAALVIAVVMVIIWLIINNR